MGKQIGDHEVSFDPGGNWVNIGPQLLGRGTTILVLDLGDGGKLIKRNATKSLINMKADSKRLLDVINKNSRYIHDENRFPAVKSLEKEGMVVSLGPHKTDNELEGTKTESNGHGVRVGAEPPKLPHVLSQLGLTDVSGANLLLEGVPGTGKTHEFGLICDHLKIDSDCRFVLNCHPSTQYEDVIEGLRLLDARHSQRLTWSAPWPDGKRVALSAGQSSSNVTSTGARQAGQEPDKSSWAVLDGVFLQACAKAVAVASGDKKVAILLDELNRANVPRILGDLMTAIEKSKRFRCKNGETLPMAPLRLPLSGREFLVPHNLVVVATMNSVDHSVAPLDQALLRRFWRLRLPVRTWAECQGDKAFQAFKTEHSRVGEAFDELNLHLASLLGEDGKVGHSYLYEMASPTNRPREVWRFGIVPQVIAAVTAAGKETWWPNVMAPGNLDAVPEPAIKTAVAAINACLRKQAGISLGLDDKGGTPVLRAVSSE